MAFGVVGELSPPVELLASAERAKSVTGFVSILTDGGDERTRVFARYYHLRRVAWIARQLATEVQPEASTSTLDWYAWGHDLNRWPFAHNSEEGAFDQAEDIVRFFADEGIPASGDQLKQLSLIVAKERSSLNPAACTVLLADMVTGFLEDPLWLMAALNVSPRIIPKHVADYLCLPLADDSFIKRIYELLRSFEPSVSPDRFIQRFDEIFSQIAAAFIAAHFPGHVTGRSNAVLGEASFLDKRALIKEDFLRGVVFPINNELISRGTTIRAILIEPMVARLPEKLARNRQMTRWTDESLVAAAIREGVISSMDRARLLPDLEYMSREQPALSFTHFIEEGRCI